MGEAGMTDNTDNRFYREAAQTYTPRYCQSCGNYVAVGMDADHEDWCSELGWKKRALEAEELNRKFMASVNGPTHMGEPVIAAHPASQPKAPPDEPTDEMIRAALAVLYPSFYKDGLYAEFDGPKTRARTAERVEIVRHQYRAMIRALLESTK
jgi:hypothetical protein